MNVRQGEVYWVAVPRPDAPEAPIRPHPWVVVQDDLFNRSRISTTVLCGLTSNPKVANEPGNVLLEPGEGGLPKASVVVVSQLSSVFKGDLTFRLGQLDADRVEAVLRGIAFQQRSGFQGPDAAGS